MNENRVVWYGDQVIRATEREGVRALWRGGEHILHKGNETVPYLEGILAASGHVGVDAGKLMATVSYDTPYAIKQHEDITLRHTGKRRARWLVLTMQEQLHRVLEIMAAELRRAFT